MTITEDTKINEIICLLKKKLRLQSASSQKDASLSAPRLVFVCGKEIVEGEFTIRKHTIDTLGKYRVSNDYGTENNKVLCIISENLYIQDLSEDIFSFEKMLAEISDKILIVAESPGTFCELGAFVMDEDCRKKTIVINEDKLEYKNSFITRGPLKLLEDQNENSVILHNGVERIKYSAELHDVLEQIAEENLSIKVNENPQSIDLKSLIYELTNIIELFQPIEGYEVEMLYKKIKGFDSYVIKNNAGHKIKNIKKLLAFMEKMEMIEKKQGYYFANRNISCYNIMFKLSRKEFNDIRIAFLNRLEKYQPKRMEII